VKGATTMTDESLQPLARLITAAEAIEGLRHLFAAEEHLDHITARVAATAAAAIVHADAVSITVLGRRGAHTAASTDDRAFELDQQQYVSGRGPCLEAAALFTPVRADVAAERHRWPEFADMASQLGVLASLSVPLIIGGTNGGQELVGSLNLYSDTSAAFDPFDEELVRLYTLAAGQAITNANRWQHSRDTVTQLERALTSRSHIDMAKGALMAVHACDADHAFALLVTDSQRRNVKLRDVAVEVLDRVTKPV
jgi:GAF domain-containing protein